MKRLIIDTSNIIFRTASGTNKSQASGFNGSASEQAGLAMHVSLMKINSYVRKFKPDQIAVTFEGAKNWRKDYTRSKECISGKLYKGNRVRTEDGAAIFELVNAFEELVRNHSTFTCLSHPRLEGDDLFAGFVQKYSGTSDEIIGVSGDKDFVQLLKHKNFTLINPDKDKPRLVEDVCGVNDAEFFMFEKAFRGDSGDNVMSAYPRVQKKRLQKCLADDYEMTKIMNETWKVTDPETQAVTEYNVGKLFEENNLLMNLEHQPQDIRQLITETIDHAESNLGKFSLGKFSQFCAKFGLEKISDNATTFAKVFSIRPPIQVNVIGFNF